MTYKNYKSFKSVTKIVNLIQTICYFMMIFFSTTFLHDIQCQSPTWFLEPIYTDIDNINIENSTKNLIYVEKGRLKGVKSITNEVIIPIQYESLNLYAESNVISVHDGKQMLYFDLEGYSVSKEIGEKAHAHWFKMNTEKNKDYTLQSGKLFGIKAKGYTAYINKAQDTVLRLTDAVNPRLFDNKFYVAEGNGSQKTRIFDLNGNFYKSLDESPNNLVHHKKGFYTNRTKDKAFLYNKDFQPINIAPSNNIWLDDSLDIMIFEYNKKYLLTDLQLKPLLADTFNVYPHRINNSSLVIIPLSKETIIYDVENKQSFTFDFNTITNEKSGDVLAFKDKDEKRGLFNFSDKKVIVEPKYDHLTFRDGLFIGRFGDKKSKHHEILNKTGKVLFAGFYNSLMIIDDGYVITDTLNKVTWYNTEGKVLKEFANGHSLTFNKESNTVRVNKLNENAKVYFIKDFLTSEKPVSYEDVGNRLNPRDKNNIPLFILKNKGKYGIIDQNGKIIINPIFSKHAQLYQDKWVVEQNGKTGAIFIPKN